MEEPTRLNDATALLRAAKDGLKALEVFEPKSSGGSVAKAALLTEAKSALKAVEAEYEAALAEWEVSEMRQLAGLPPQ